MIEEIPIIKKERKELKVLLLFLCVADSLYYEERYGDCD